MESQTAVVTVACLLVVLVHGPAVLKTVTIANACIGAIDVNCTTAVSLLLRLDGSSDAFGEFTITEVSSGETTYRFKEGQPLRVRARIDRTVVSMALTRLNDGSPICNVHEHVDDAGVDCAVTPGVGRCKGRPALCCIGGLRGSGDHCCERSDDASECYVMYAFATPTIQHDVSVTAEVASTPTHLSINVSALTSPEVTLGNVTVTALSPFIQLDTAVQGLAQGHVLLVRVDAVDALMTNRPVANETVLVLEQSAALSQGSRFNMSCTRWALENIGASSCNQPRDFKTHTHTIRAHWHDQFFALKQNQTLCDFVSPSSRHLMVAPSCSLGSSVFVGRRGEDSLLTIRNALTGNPVELTIVVSGLP